MSNSKSNILQMQKQQQIYNSAQKQKQKQQFQELQELRKEITQKLTNEKQHSQNNKNILQQSLTVQSSQSLKKSLISNCSQLSSNNIDISSKNNNTSQKNQLSQQKTMKKKNFQLPPTIPQQLQLSQSTTNHNNQQHKKLLNSQTQLSIDLNSPKLQLKNLLSGSISASNNSNNTNNLTANLLSLSQQYPSLQMLSNSQTQRTNFNAINNSTLENHKSLQYLQQSSQSIQIGSQHQLNQSVSKKNSFIQQQNSLKKSLNKQKLNLKDTNLAKNIGNKFSVSQRLQNLGKSVQLIKCVDNNSSQQFDSINEQSQPLRIEDLDVQSLKMQQDKNRNFSPQEINFNQTLPISQIDFDVKDSTAKKRNSHINNLLSAKLLDSHNKNSQTRQPNHRLTLECESTHLVTLKKQANIKKYLSHSPESIEKIKLQKFLVTKGLNPTSQLLKKFTSESPHAEALNSMSSNQNLKIQQSHQIQNTSHSKNSKKKQKPAQVFQLKDLGMSSSLNKLKQHFQMQSKLMKSTSNLNNDLCVLSGLFQLNHTGRDFLQLGQKDKNVKINTNNSLIQQNQLSSEKFQLQNSGIIDKNFQNAVLNTVNDSGQIKANQMQQQVIDDFSNSFHSHNQSQDVSKKNKTQKQFKKNDSSLQSSLNHKNQLIQSTKNQTSQNKMQQNFLAQSGHKQSQNELINDTYSSHKKQPNSIIQPQTNSKLRQEVEIYENIALKNVVQENQQLKHRLEHLEFQIGSMDQLRKQMNIKDKLILTLQQSLIKLTTSNMNNIQETPQFQHEKYEVQDLQDFEEQKQDQQYSISSQERIKHYGHAFKKNNENYQKSIDQQSNNHQNMNNIITPQKSQQNQVEIFITNSKLKDKQSQKQFHQNQQAVNAQNKKLKRKLKNEIQSNSKNFSEMKLQFGSVECEEIVNQDKFQFEKQLQIEEDQEPQLQKKQKQLKIVKTHEQQERNNGQNILIKNYEQEQISFQRQPDFGQFTFSNQDYKLSNIQFQKSQQSLELLDKKNDNLQINNKDLQDFNPKNKLNNQDQISNNIIFNKYRTNQGNLEQLQINQRDLNFTSKNQFSGQDASGESINQNIIISTLNEGYSSSVLDNNNMSSSFNYQSSSNNKINQNNIMMNQDKNYHSTQKIQMNEKYIDTKDALKHKTKVNNYFNSPTNFHQKIKQISAKNLQIGIANANKTYNKNQHQQNAEFSLFSPINTDGEFKAHKNFTDFSNQIDIQNKTSNDHKTINFNNQNVHQNNMDQMKQLIKDSAYLQQNSINYSQKSEVYLQSNQYNQSQIMPQNSLQYHELTTQHNEMGDSDLQQKGKNKKGGKIINLIREIKQSKNIQNSQNQSGKKKQFYQGSNDSKEDLQQSFGKQSNLNTQKSHQNSKINKIRSSISQENAEDKQIKLNLNQAQLQIQNTLNSMENEVILKSDTSSMLQQQNLKPPFVSIDFDENLVSPVLQEEMRRFKNKLCNFIGQYQNHIQQTQVMSDLQSSIKNADDVSQKTKNNKLESEKQRIKQQIQLLYDQTRMGISMPFRNQLQAASGLGIGVGYRSTQDVMNYRNLDSSSDICGSGERGDKGREQNN